MHLFLLPPETIKIYTIRYKIKIKPFEGIKIERLENINMPITQFTKFYFHCHNPKPWL